MRGVRFSPEAIEQFADWHERNRKTTQRIFRPINEIQRTPFEGIGRPEPLKHELAGCWSRRIDHEHRLVYRVTEDEVRVISCRYHYRG